MMGRRSSKQPAKRKANRRLSPQEQLVRNIATPEAETRKRPTRSSGHARPLDPTDSGDGRRRTPRREPGRVRLAFRKAFAPIRHSLTGEWLGGPEVIRHLPFVAFLCALFIGYIYLEYRYEYDERAIKEGRREVRNLRHHEQALRGRFESQLQRSRLDEAMADADLAAPDSPPVLLPDNAPTP